MGKRKALDSVAGSKLPPQGAKEKQSKKLKFSKMMNAQQEHDEFRTNAVTCLLVDDPLMGDRNLFEMFKNNINRKHITVANTIYERSAIPDSRKVLADATLSCLEMVTLLDPIMDENSTDGKCSSLLLTSDRENKRFLGIHIDDDECKKVLEIITIPHAPTLFCVYNSATVDKTCSSLLQFIIFASSKPFVAMIPLNQPSHSSVRNKVIWKTETMSTVNCMAVSHQRKLLFLRQSLSSRIDIMNADTAERLMVFQIFPHFPPKFSHFVWDEEKDQLLLNEYDALAILKFSSPTNTTSNKMGPLTGQVTIHTLPDCPIITPGARIMPINMNGVYVLLLPCGKGIQVYNLQTWEHITTLSIQGESLCLRPMNDDDYFRQFVITDFTKTNHIRSESVRLSLNNICFPFNDTIYNIVKKLNGKLPAVIETTKDVKGRSIRLPYCIATFLGIIWEQETDFHVDMSDWRPADDYAVLFPNSLPNEDGDRGIQICEWLDNNSDSLLIIEGVSDVVCVKLSEVFEYELFTRGCEGDFPLYIIEEDEGTTVKTTFRTLLERISVVKAVSTTIQNKEVQFDLNFDNILKEFIKTGSNYYNPSSGELRKDVLTECYAKLCKNEPPPTTSHCFGISCEQMLALIFTLGDRDSFIPTSSFQIYNEFVDDRKIDEKRCRRPFNNYVVWNGIQHDQRDVLVLYYYLSIVPDATTKLKPYQKGISRH
ncbi:hypothetical protein C9374_012858 [Naegleria lovaniensis]|uniref:Uncharacterized protein n=1 Tax=Naegleria lovaniensis TaxID=51637 RepID=A0AA88GFJ8_NAELO|nr:uncharacterized protein C9374_012858 [Naegleria lovaniensis]KAG2373126.1 hypothetical protein C9374_012858 [Naegleria lovaniensis]